MSGASFILGQDGVLREPPGHAALWGVFGLSRACWLCLPRVMMHEMPDDWQWRMAELITEFQDQFQWPDEIDGTEVVVRQNGRLAKLPEWLSYRHPDYEKIESFRRKT